MSFKLKTKEQENTQLDKRKAFDYESTDDEDGEGKQTALLIHSLHTAEKVNYWGILETEVGSPVLFFCQLLQVKVFLPKVTLLFLMMITDGCDISEY